MDPGLVGPELLASFAGLTSVGAFLPLCPSAMSGPDPRASKSRYTIIDTTGSHQINACSACAADGGTADWRVETLALGPWNAPY